MNICHFTSVHQRFDTRIFIKECRTLAASGNKVTLIVADGKGNERKNDVDIIDSGKALANRFARLLFTGWKVYKLAKKQKADIYHFHDPELMAFAYILKISGTQVVYDVHEDLPRQIISNKPYLPPFTKKIISWFSEIAENFFSKKFSAIVTVTPYIADRFTKRCDNVEVLYNFPIVNLEDEFPSWENKTQAMCYVGSLSEARGVVELIQSLDCNNLKLHLAGSFNDAKLENKVKTMSSWDKVNYHGYVSREKLYEILETSMVGVVTLHHTDNYKFSIPVKLFEYMRAGIPVVISDIPLWKRMVEQANCGMVVDPTKPESIASAIKQIIDNPKKAEELGRNGWKMVRERYNWANEEIKLLKLYEKLV